MKQITWGAARWWVLLVVYATGMALVAGGMKWAANNGGNADAIMLLVAVSFVAGVACGMWAMAKAEGMQ